MTFWTNPLKSRRRNCLQQLVRDVKTVLEVVTPNWAEIWIFCSCTELWISCMAAISSIYPRDPQATLLKTHSALPQLVPRVGRQPRAKAKGPAGSWSTSQCFHAQGILSTCTWGPFPTPPNYSDPNPTGDQYVAELAKKTIAAKLLAAGFWISLQKAWHKDQSRMASPIQG